MKASAQELASETDLCALALRAVQVMNVSEVSILNMFWMALRLRSPCVSLSQISSSTNFAVSLDLARSLTMFTDSPLDRNIVLAS
jgi:hypothetical protein